jgi:hypothetical protein
VVPFAIDESGGVIVIEVSVAVLTVTVVEPETPLRVAVIEVLPMLRPVTSPWLSVASLTSAIVLSAAVQLT